jgi:hypothetical protein
MHFNSILCNFMMNHLIREPDSRVGQSLQEKIAEIGTVVQEGDNIWVIRLRDIHAEELHSIRCEPALSSLGCNAHELFSCTFHGISLLCGSKSACVIVLKVMI